MVWVFNWGLEKFLPEQKLKPGDEIPDVLTPPDVEDRPHLTCAFDDQGVAGSDDDEDDEQPDRDWDRPTTKEELHQLRERHGNNRRTATYFYKQRRIQMEARIIYIGARLVAKEFGDTVPCLRWQAARAAGHTWFSTILDTVQLLHDAEVLSCLDILIPVTAAFVVSEEQEDPEEQARLQLFFRFLCELCSARSWSQMQFATLCPQFLAVIFHDSLDVRQAGLAKAKEIWTAVLAAEKIVHDSPGAPLVSQPVKAKLATCLRELAWNQLLLARESFSVCRAGDWDHSFGQLRILGHRLFGRPTTTKHFLEDGFAHLSDIAKRHMKGQTMQRWTKYLCTMGAPSTRNSKWPQVRQTAEDYRSIHKDRATQPESEKVALHKKSFLAAQQRLPDGLQEFLKEDKLSSNIKKAGVESNQKSTAATAWVCQHVNRWDLAPMAWAGRAGFKCRGNQVFLKFTACFQISISALA
eukprot:s481_g13.t2